MDDLVGQQENGNDERTGIAMTSGHTLLVLGDAMEHVLPKRLFLIGPLPFTDQMLVMLVVGGILLVVFALDARRYPMVPTGFRMFLETGLHFVREGVARPVLKEHTDRFIPFIWTLFFFILVNNLLGLVPLNAIAGLLFGQWHLFGTATANLSVTAALAGLVFVTIHISGMTEECRHQRKYGRSWPVAVVMGFLMYWYHFVPHIPGVLGVVLFPFFLVLEIIGALIKPFALAIRLFANIMAGHILLGSLLLMLPAIRNLASGGVVVPGLLGCTALSFLELFVAFLQAYIFTFLTCLFIGAAVSPEH